MADYVEMKRLHNRFCRHCGMLCTREAVMVTPKNNDVVSHQHWIYKCPRYRWWKPWHTWKDECSFPAWMNYFLCMFG